MSDSIANTPIKMWPALDYTEFVTVKLQQEFDNGSFSKENLPSFDGEGGSTGNVKAFLYVHKRFISTANRKMQWNDLDKFESFEDVLRGKVQHYWTDMVYTHTNVVAVADADKFQVATNLMTIRFCGKCAAGDALLEYLYSEKARKEKNKSVAEHVGRLCTLVGYTKELPRKVAPRPDDNIEKKIIFDSFPYQWKLNFNNSGALYHEKSINELSKYMECQKTNADANTSKKRISNQDLKGQKFKSLKKGNRCGQNGNKGFRNQCTLHEPPNNNHEWADCILNPRSATFCGNSGGRGRGHSHGDGRGHGNGGGRGYSNHSNRNNQGGNSYNFNNGNNQNQNYNYQGQQNRNQNNNQTNNNPEGNSNQQGLNGSNEQHFLMDNNNVWGVHHGAFN
ncbi:predicted protein [Chaetoceros tenuissimus]|uniref:Uncharacterized protein n=1 Tax=Chaetoceros tenuissimus TaxID=426638 RepID=A0AAD3CTQ7_9STRA|nr:predicted protein [Chaetoceros tenuissimus]